jgi:hypothetical protein
MLVTWFHSRDRLRSAKDRSPPAVHVSHVAASSPPAPPPRGGPRFLRCVAHHHEPLRRSTTVLLARPAPSGGARAATGERGRSHRAGLHRPHARHDGRSPRRDRTRVGTATRESDLGKLSRVQRKWTGRGALRPRPVSRSGWRVFKPAATLGGSRIARCHGRNATLPQLRSGDGGRGRRLRQLRLEAGAGISRRPAGGPSS